MRDEKKELILVEAGDPEFGLNYLLFGSVFTSPEGVAKPYQLWVTSDGLMAWDYSGGWHSAEKLTFPPWAQRLLKVYHNA